MGQLADQTLNVSSSVLQAKRNNEQRFLSRSGVRSVGVSRDNRGNEVIVVGVEQQGQLQSVQSAIPSSIQGFNVETQVVGDIVPQQRQGTNRPVPMGVSVAHPNVTAGTTGWLFETDDGTRYIASNNHVMADVNQASVGDSIYQPGPADGGTSGDTIGSLAYFATIQDGVDVDLAVAEPAVDIVNNVFEENAPINGTVGTLSVGDTLTKSGRTTGIQSASIDQLDVAIDVNYGTGTFTISGCIITESMSDGGDSGSPTYKRTSDGLLAAGLVFAGSDTLTAHSHIDNIIDRLKNEFDSSTALVVDDGGGGGDNFAIDGPSTVNVGESNTWSATNLPTDTDRVEWDFGDGTTDTGQSVTHTYSSTGNFSITAEAIGPTGSVLGTSKARASR